MLNPRFVRLSVLLAVVSACLAPDARADFVIRSAPTPTPAPIAMAPIAAPGDMQGPPSSQTMPTAPSALHWKMAYGFGTAVPLGFACRQIVPPAVRVTFGPGARPDMVVTWKGGDTWNHVLRDAVAPLGLLLVMSHMAVEIRK
jgi:hypothetical protein